MKRFVPRSRRQVANSELLCRRCSVPHRPTKGAHPWSIGFVVCIALTACTDSSRSVIVSVDRAELQERVDVRFPIANSTLLTNVVLQDPRVMLTDGSDRLGIGLSIGASLPLLGTVNGTLVVSGELAYDSQSKGFFLYRPRLDTLNIDGIGPTVTATARQGIESAAHLALAELPIYTLRARTLQEVAAGHVLKSVRVRNGKLYLELGLP